MNLSCKKREFGIFIFGIWLALLSLCPATPDGHGCSEWQRVTSTKIGFDKISDLITQSIKFIPSAPKPSIKGSIIFNTFKRTGCCEGQEELRRGRIGGDVSAGVATGPLPIPGLSLPAGVGGVFVRAATNVAVAVTGESTQQCRIPYNTLRVSGALTGNVTIGGGVNAWGDFLYGEVRGIGSFGGSGSWSEDEGLVWNDANCQVSVNLVLGGFFEETVVAIAQINARI